MQRSKHLCTVAARGNVSWRPPLTTGTKTERRRNEDGTKTERRRNEDGTKTDLLIKFCFSLKAGNSMFSFFLTVVRNSANVTLLRRGMEEKGSLLVSVDVLHDRVDYTPLVHTQIEISEKQKEAAGSNRKQKKCLYAVVGCRLA